MSQMENEAERRLREACKTAKKYEDASEKTRAALMHIYGYNRRVSASRSGKTEPLAEHAGMRRWP